MDTLGSCSTFLVSLVTPLYHRKWDYCVKTDCCLIYYAKSDLIHHLISNDNFTGALTRTVLDFTACSLNLQLSITFVWRKIQQCTREQWSMTSGVHMTSYWWYHEIMYIILCVFLLVGWYTVGWSGVGRAWWISLWTINHIQKYSWLCHTERCTSNSFHLIAVTCSWEVWHWTLYGWPSLSTCCMSDVCCWW